MPAEHQPIHRSLRCYHHRTMHPTSGHALSLTLLIASCGPSVELSDGTAGGTVSTTDPNPTAASASTSGAPVFATEEAIVRID